MSSTRLGWKWFSRFSEPQLGNGFRERQPQVGKKLSKFTDGLLLDLVEFLTIPFCARVVIDTWNGTNRKLGSNLQRLWTCTDFQLEMRLMNGGFWPAEVFHVIHPNVHELRCPCHYPLEQRHRTFSDLPWLWRPAVLFFRDPGPEPFKKSGQLSREKWLVFSSVQWRMFRIYSSILSHSKP